MWLLVISFGLAVGVSALCSLTEAVLYSVSWSYIESLRKKGKKSGEILYQLKSNIDRPITAILTLNTVANTAGASIAGAAAMSVFGEEKLYIFSIVFTLTILFFSEIIPKTVGVLYNRFFATILARPLMGMVILFLPIINIISFTIRFFEKGKSRGLDTSEEDVLALVSLSRKTGVLKHFEEKYINNVLELDKKRVMQVMTPRTVMFSLPAEMSIDDSIDVDKMWPYSRVPIFFNGDIEDIRGIVYKVDVLRCIIKGQGNKKLYELKKPVHFVLETITLDRLLLTFLESRIPMAIVLDEYGGISGLITLEDILEEILGKEIVDETDRVEDMRRLAEKKKQEIFSKIGEDNK
ncbi:hemolysin family protein [Desulfothermus okinawensis JCM 13304]